MKDGLRLFVLTNMFPSENSQKGIFVKELVDCIELEDRISYVKVFNLDDGAVGYKKYLLSVHNVFKELKGNQIDVINVHFGLSFIPLFFLLPYLWWNNIKITLHLHGSDLMGSKFVNLISNFSILFSDKVIVVSKHMMDYIWPYSRHDVDIIPCGVDRLFKYANRAEWKKNNEIKIIFPSSPSRPEKNYALFSEVVENLALMGVGVKIVCFEDFSREQILNALFDANILFLSSLREGSPQVVKEAVLTGLPVISTNVGDVVDILSGIPGDKAFISSDPDDIVEWIINTFSGCSIDKKIVDVKFEKYSNFILTKRVVDILYSAVG